MAKREATTRHGTVEYEVVECDSCGNEIAKEDAWRFIVAEDLQTDRTRYGYHRWETTKSAAYTTGWCCEFCREDPVTFPTPTRLRHALSGFDREQIVVGGAFLLMFVLAGVSYLLHLLGVM